MSSPAFDLVAVCGPNASGKTHLGVDLARRCDGEIISVDSRQVYRGLDIGSGKDLAEYETPEGPVPYHLIDIADPHDIYSLWHFVGDFDQALAGIRTRRRLPIAVGGTGLYLEAVLKGYEVPQVPPDEPLRHKLMERPHFELEEQLRRLDPERFDLADRSSKKRTVRALEIAIARQNGTARVRRATAPDNPLIIGVRWDRSVLRQRIEKRLDQRLSEGLVEEVEQLMRDGVDLERLELLGMEYRHVGRHLAGQVDFTQMRADLLQSIGKLAKRQDTWFRGMERRGTPIHWVEGSDRRGAAEELESLILQGDS